MYYGDESDHDIISTDMIEDICDRTQTHLRINRREACYKIRDSIRQRQLDWKGVLKAMQSMGKSLHKVFKTVVKEIYQDYHLWENMVWKFPISFQKLETYLK